MGNGLRGEGHLTWRKTADKVWATNPKRLGNYYGTITYTVSVTPGLGDEYVLVINPGAISTDHDTLKQAKNEFRKFLFDKPSV